MVPKWRPEITKSSKWLPKLLFGEKGRILTPLGGPWELNGVIFRSFWEPFWNQNCEKRRRKAVRKSVS